MHGDDCEGRSRRSRRLSRSVADSVAALIGWACHRSSGAWPRLAKRGQRTIRTRESDLRDMPDVDLEVLARGFGFLPAMMRESISEDEPRQTRYVDEMFELEMRTFLPVTAAGDEFEIGWYAVYFFDAWLLQNVAEFIAHARSLETARRYYQPIASPLARGLGIGSTISYTRGFA